MAIKINGNTVIDDDRNFLDANSVTVNGTLHIDTTGAVEMPSGNTAQRPTPVTGMLRFNSEDSSFEGYDGAEWGAIGGASPGINDLADAVAITISNTENVGINDTTPSYKLDVNGTIRATGDMIAESDARVKENIETLDGTKVFAMRGVSFTKNGEQGSGVIAQELQEIAPELVKTEAEYLAVAYGNLTGYLIEAVKLLNDKVNALETELQELKK